MIKVIGAVAEIVPLPDLGDRVYYKQQKVFSDDQLKKSLDLQKEIKKGRLLVVQETEEKSANFDIPEIKDSPVSQEKKEKLISHVKDLGDQINKKDRNREVIDKLIGKIEKLESLIENKEPSNDISTILSAFEKLEKKVDQASVNGDVLKKIEDIIKRAPVGVPQQQLPERSKRIVASEDVYVPKVTVKDGSSNINLKIRTVEKSGGIDSAAEALKKLRNRK